MKKYNLNLDQRYVEQVCGRGDYCENISLTFKLKGKLDLNKFEDAIQKTVENNDAFHFKVHKDKESGKLYLGLYDDVTYKLDLRKAVGETYEERYKMVSEDAGAVDNNSPLIDNYAWTFVLYDMGDEEYIFYGRMNHLVFDALSISLTFGSIMAYYNDMPVKKGASYCEYIEEQQERKHSEVGRKKAEEYKDLTDSMKNYSYVFDSFQDGADERNLVYDDFITIGGDKLMAYCKENKMSLFHVNLLLFHLAIAIIYKKDSSAILIPSGVRDMKYMNTIGLVVNLGWNLATFNDDMTVREAAKQCRNSFFRNSMANDIITETLIENELPLDFILTYQNYISYVKKEVSIGEAKFEMIQDPTFGRGRQIVKKTVAIVGGIEKVDEAVCILKADQTVYPKDKALRIYNLALKCLTEEDMTIGQFRKEVE